MFGWVSQTDSQAGLGSQTLDQLLIEAVGGEQALERQQLGHRAAAHLSEEDLGHAAAAELAQELITAELFHQCRVYL
jgi:hypothetical protein